MKNLILVLTGILLSTIGFAQRRTATHRTTVQKHNVQLGLKAGVNIANYNDAANSIDSRVGFHGGLLAQILVNPKFGIQPELVYSQQGAKFRTGTDKLDYLNIPILFQYLTPGGFRLETGPQIGVLANAKFKYENGVEVDIKNTVKSSDIAWAFGLGFISSSGLGIDARYNLGLTDITNGNPDIKNRVWQIGAFYQFRH
jgi:hypothetical protein